MTEHTISSLCTRSHEISKSKGWLENPRPFPTLCLLMHTEVSEACEDWRNNRKPEEIYYETKWLDPKGGTLKFELAKPTPWAPLAPPANIAEISPGLELLEAKPCGIPIEFADVVIRIAQWAGTAGVGAALEKEYVSIDHETKPYNNDFEEVLAWVHVDISEAVKAEWRLREGLHDAELRPLPGVPFAQHPRLVHHLAQAMWRLFKLSDANKIDLWAAIDEKEAFNKTRPARHGGKKI